MLVLLIFRGKDKIGFISLFCMVLHNIYYYNDNHNWVRFLEINFRYNVQNKCSIDDYHKWTYIIYIIDIFYLANLLNFKQINSNISNPIS